MMKYVESCIATDTMIVRLSPSAATVVRPHAPIAVKIRGRESPVVQVAWQRFRRRIS